MYASITVTIDLPVYPERVYRAWLDSFEHAHFTNSPARIDPHPGGSFKTLDGRIQGIIKALSPFDRIFLSWNDAGFPANDPQANVELKLAPTCTGTELSFTHRGVAPGSTRQILQWWDDTYLRPLRQYFDELVGEYVADMGDG